MQFSGVNVTRLYVGTANGVYAGTTGNGPFPGPVKWRKVDERRASATTRSSGR